jgi:hypothetical protein
MDPNSFISHVGYSAGLPKAARTATGGRTILAILVAAGAVQSADGKIVAVSQGDTSPTDRSDTSSVRVPPAPRPTVTSAPSANVRDDVTVTVRVNINVNADELRGLGRRLRAELEQLRADYEVEVEDADVAEPG